jgi:DnaJ-class molecular chaperone
MPPPPVEDYYAVLGVDVGADEEALRTAWRRLAAQWHPDRAGPVAAATFQRIAAAYAVLSDPLARAAYDHRQRIRHPDSAATARPMPPAKPAAPATMLSRLCGNLNSLLARGAARYDDDEPPGVITLVLRQAEAAQGGMATISLRADLRCPECAAKGLPAEGCVRCAGAGVVDELYSAWLAIPPGVAEGELLAPTVELPGMIEPVRFRLRMATRRSPDADGDAPTDHN